MRDRIVHQLMLDGVTVVDPASVWVDSSVSVACDAVLLPNVHLQGATTVGAATIGPDCTLTDTVVEAGANIGDVVRALYTLGISPRDLIGIMQAIKAAGALNAELVII